MDGGEKEGGTHGKGMEIEELVFCKTVGEGDGDGRVGGVVDGGHFVSLAEEEVVCCCYCCCCCCDELVS